MNKIFIFGLLLLLLDLPFIKYVMQPRYKIMFPDIQTNLVYMLCAYALMILSWYLINGNVMLGALTGMIIYGVYAFTLLALFPKYTLSSALIEIIWGTLLFSSITFLTNKIQKHV
jgi:uncharacterized membrane protein